MASKKRKLKRKYKILLMIIVIVIAILLSFLFFKEIFKIYMEEELPQTSDKQDINDNIDNESNQKYHLSMVMVGDNLIHDDIYEEAKKYGNGENYNFKPMFELIKPIVSEYDIAYYNQETILGGSEIGVSSYPAFNSPYEVGDAMIDAGFNLVSLATNHTIDRGETAIINSRNYWNSKYINSPDSILAVGSYSSYEERNEISVREMNHITYTMLNYTYGTNGIPVPSNKSYLVNVWPVTGSDPNTDSAYQEYKEQVKKDIEAVRNKVDVLIVAMHWGIEYQLTPNSYQKDIANFLASLGVDIIIGTHPHVIQPIEWINNTLVIYSLGNFISAHEVVNLDNRIGLMSSVEIIKEVGKDGNSVIKLENLENELLYTYYTSDYKSFLVMPFSQMKEEYLSDYKSVYEKYKNIVQEIDNSIKVK